MNRAIVISYYPTKGNFGRLRLLLNVSPAPPCGAICLVELKTFWKIFGEKQLY